VTDWSPFSSSCPSCGQAIVQKGYDADELREALAREQEIEAWCSACGKHWIVPNAERFHIARGLEKTE
jgi:predicted RNA-binding Zn-ribbon protein involved in translation (DUF1610 family)